MQQSVHRIEELVKIFIHATKVSAGTRPGQRMSPGPLGLTRSTDTTRVDGNRVLGNVCLGLREAGEVGSGSLVEGEEYMLLQKREGEIDVDILYLNGRWVVCGVVNMQKCGVVDCHLPSPSCPVAILVSVVTVLDSLQPGSTLSGTCFMPEYPGTMTLSRLSAPLTAQRPAAGCQVTPARKYFLGPKRCR